LLGTIFAIFAQRIPSATGSAACSSERIRSSQLSLHFAACGSIHRSAWKMNSANFACIGFWEVRAEHSRLA
jgi:hypothetical protein